MPVAAWIVVSARTRRYEIVPPKIKTKMVVHPRKPM